MGARNDVLTVYGQQRRKSMLASGLDDLTIICAVLVAAQLVVIVLSVVAVSDFVKWRKERKK